VPPQRLHSCQHPVTILGRHVHEQTKHFTRSSAVSIQGCGQDPARLRQAMKWRGCKPNRKLPLLVQNYWRRWESNKWRLKHTWGIVHVISRRMRRATGAGLEIPLPITGRHLAVRIFDTAISDCLIGTDSGAENTAWGSSTTPRLVSYCTHQQPFGSRPA
jgi:hypothetical protein